MAGATKSKRYSGKVQNIPVLPKNRSIGPELTTAKTGPIHLSSFVEIAFVD